MTDTFKIKLIQLIHPADTALTAAVQQFNGRNWKAIAALVPGRTYNQCYCRWKKVLSTEKAQSAD